MSVRLQSFIVFELQVIYYVLVGESRQQTWICALTFHRRLTRIHSAVAGLIRVCLCLQELVRPLRRLLLPSATCCASPQVRSARLARSARRHVVFHPDNCKTLRPSSESTKLNICRKRRQRKEQEPGEAPRCWTPSAFLLLDFHVLQKWSHWMSRCDYFLNALALLTAAQVCQLSSFVSLWWTFHATNHNYKINYPSRLRSSEIPQTRSHRLTSVLHSAFML